MVTDVNTLVVSGRLAREVVLTDVGDNKKAVINLAVSRSYKQGDEVKEKTTWINVEMWGNLANIISEYASKGQRVTCVGRLDYDTWEDKEGQKRNALYMTATQVLLGEKAKGTKSGEGVSPEALTAAVKKVMALVDQQVDADVAIAAVMKSLGV